jgi:hypothetical protein
MSASGGLFLAHDLGDEIHRRGLAAGQRREAQGAVGHAGDRGSGEREANRQIIAPEELLLVLLQRGEQHGVGKRPLEAHLVEQRCQEIGRAHRL